jgi:hypothetical protein
MTPPELQTISLDVVFESLHDQELGHVRDRWHGPTQTVPNRPHTTSPQYKLEQIPFEFSHNPRA